MTAPNRWYQLSMLQLLVAMSCLVGIVYVNAMPRMNVRDVVLYTRHKGGEPFKRVESHFGWPLEYRITITHTVQSIGQSTGSKDKPYAINADQFKTRPALLNVLSGVVLFAAALLCSRPK